MKAKLQKIGNSRGIRIPKAILDEMGFETAVELSVENNRLVISPIRSVRAQWEEAFQAATPANPDENVEFTQNDFDQREWTW